MWMFYAIGSSFFAGITSILAKCGIRKTDSDVATALRTVVVLIFSWLDGVDYRNRNRNHTDQWKNLTVFGAVRAGYRSFLVMLFSCTAKGGHQ